MFVVSRAGLVAPRRLGAPSDISPSGLGRVVRQDKSRRSGRDSCFDDLSMGSNVRGYWASGAIDLWDLGGPRSICLACQGDCAKRDRAEGATAEGSAG